MTILFVTEIAPFPPNGGEKLRSYGLLKLMSDLNYKVHAITGNTTTDNLQHSIKNITFYPFDFSRTKSNHRVRKYIKLMSGDPNLKSLINRILNKEHIDAGFIDYYFYGQYIDLFKKLKIPVIYGTHNAQAVLINQQPALSFKNSIGKLVDYVFYRFHEYHFFSKADALIVVSEDDRKYHARFIKKNRIYTIPNFLVQEDYISENEPKENYVLMTANFKAFQNSFGIEWFIREIWNNELAEKTRLLLVGLGSKEVFNRLKDKYYVNNITALGEVSDLKPYIKQAKVSIVPLLHGSGSRLKCLESMALKTQLISTSKGAEGIEHKGSIIIADSPAAFRKSIIDVIETGMDYTAKAYESFAKKYSLESNRQIFAGILGDIVKNNVAE
jgi:hypothetical protein